eukprot:5587284-Prymnesium_polylepis.1
MPPSRLTASPESSCAHSRPTLTAGPERSSTRARASFAHARACKFVCRAQTWPLCATRARARRPTAGSCTTSRRASRR